MTKPRFSPMRKQCLPSECGVGNLAVDVDSNLGEQLPEPLMATSYYTMERREECRRADSLWAMYACSTSARTSLVRSVADCWLGWGPRSSKLNGRALGMCRGAPVPASVWHLILSKAPCFCTSIPARRVLPWTSIVRPAPLSYASWPRSAISWSRVFRPDTWIDWDWATPR